GIRDLIVTGVQTCALPIYWGRGANQGFYTLLPYDAQVSKDGTIWAGLQDNGELKIEPGGRQVETYGGDGTYSAVDPDNADTAYEIGRASCRERVERQVVAG